MSSISVQINTTTLAPQEIVSSLVAKQGPIDIYCWYEGPRGLPKSGAAFYKEFLFDPIVQQKPDAMLNLYSLKGWNFAKTASDLSDTPLGKAIDRCNLAAIRCAYSSSFFQYCMSLPKESRLYCWIDAELPRKQWLAELSANYKPSGKSVAQLFENQPTLFDAIRDLDVSQAYSYMQYVEGYYLIREAVTRSLAQGNCQAQIAFVLPNDEGKYYQDLPQDLEPMLRADFGQALDGISIDTSFFFFPYGDRLSARPYQGNRYVKPEEIAFYLPYARTVGINEEACS